MNEFITNVTNRIARYRMSKQEDPCYIVVNSYTWNMLKKNYLLNFTSNNAYFFNGLKLLIDDTLTNFEFKVVGD